MEDRGALFADGRRTVHVQNRPRKGRSNNENVDSSTPYLERLHKPLKPYPTAVPLSPAYSLNFTQLWSNNGEGVKDVAVFGGRFGRYGFCYLS